MASCVKKTPAAVNCTNVGFSDTTGNVLLTMNLDLPVAVKGPAKVICDSLVAQVVGQLESFGYYEDEPHRLPPYSGKAGNLGALVAHYGEAVNAYLDSLATEDVRERLEVSDFAPKWEYQVGLTKVEETDKYVLFNSSNYIYMGGAHGGVTGEGDIIFRKSDGARIRNVIDRSRVMEMQDLIQEGLQAYGEDMDYLFIEDGVFPLPVWEPSLTKEGVSFTYQQYEIAPYAFGMPSFTIPYEKAMEFLTPEAKALVD